MNSRFGIVEHQDIHFHVKTGVELFSPNQRGDNLLNVYWTTNGVFPEDHYWSCENEPFLQRKPERRSSDAAIYVIWTLDPSSESNRELNTLVT